MPFLKRDEINLDIGISCALQCPKCDRENMFKDIRPIPGHNMSVSEFRKISEHFPKIIMCGQISDPIFNPNLLEFIKISKKNNCRLGIYTAASQKQIKWYEECFDNFGRGRWVFGIDGLPKDSHKYRINQDGEKLWEVAKICVSKGIHVEWQYIVFKYNENDIEEAKKMADDYGIEFNLNVSSRWLGRDDPYMPTNPKYRIFNDIDMRL